MPKFQRRHYTAIAEVIATIRNRRQSALFSEAELVHFAEAMAVYFADDNPRFNRSRFLAACGVDADTTGNSAHKGE